MDLSRAEVHIQRVRQYEPAFKIPAPGPMLTDINGQLYKPETEKGMKMPCPCLTIALTIPSAFQYGDGYLTRNHPNSCFYFISFFNARRKSP